MQVPAYLVQSLKFKLHCQVPSRLEKQLLPLILGQPNRSLVVEVSSLVVCEQHNHKSVCCVPTSCIRFEREV